MMQTQREFWRSSMVLLGCNTLAGILNYAFQVLAARRLEVADYGRLNLWIADITIVLSLGTIAQMVANYFPMAPSSLRKLALSALAVATAVALSLGLVSSDSGIYGYSAGTAALGLGLMSGWLSGQVQARMQFALLGMALVAGAGLKLLIAGLVSMQGVLTPYYLAVSMGFLAPIALIAVRSLAHPFTVVTSVAEDRVKAKIICASLLALATALIPQLDIINLRQFQTSEVLGQYARVMLAAKAIFFGAAAILQVALPFHLRSQDANMNHSAGGAIRRAELTVVGVCFVASGFAALVLPWLSPLLFRFELSGYQLWIFLTGFIASVQFALLQEIQRDCAKLAWRRAGLVLLALGLVLLWGWFGPAVDVRSYLVVAAIYYAAVLGLRLRIAR
jgi:O-antigen/teichoic acid export membrane protein